jgi:hypothetical protein
MKNTVSRVSGAVTIFYKIALSDIGLNSSEYGLHSFRAGSGTAVANRGFLNYKVAGKLI